MGEKMCTCSTMADEQQFCLRWNNFQMNITSQFEALRDEEDFVDVTLACEGQRLKAHKVVLSACSPYFKELFKSNPCKHPILFMRDVEFRHLKSLVEFMYAGEVNVAQAQLSAFLRTAESLQIRGLTEAPQRHSRFDGATSDTGHSRRGTRSGIPTSPIAGAPEEDDILSLSPPASPSPPAKRPCTAPDPANIKREAPDIVEPKLEVPDYSSDGESRTESGNGAHYGGIENPLDAKSAYATGGLQGGMEMIPGTSAAHNFLSDVSTLPQEPASQGNRVGWCPPTLLRHAMSSWSRDHSARYFGTPPNFVGDEQDSKEMVPLAAGVLVPASLLQRVNRADYRKLTRGLASALFSPLELGSSSVTGQRWTRAGYCSGRPTKPALDRRRVEAILAYVGTHFPTIERSKVKQVLAYKCKESAAALRVRGSKLLGLKRTK
ncbi:broad-complex core protein isoforms 1/2/3/4/5-like isoform X2 [Schistocerca cancellata]|uniref:broad-complex core protein isoforms 1/2/3/4/5-like isoform X2 n=2 Tax=Schistocerca TaxID=7008 RepID=UPI0021183BC8|nr:broad-complex core protein isoforms 1/2/3/4/5-like isoform X2 [Schistocerca cancellata]